MKVLYLAHRIHFPPNKGEKIRAFHQISYLAKKHEIHLVCLVDDKKDLKYIENLHRYCHKVYFAFISRKIAKIKSLLLMWFLHAPITNHYFYKHSLIKTVKQILQKESFDIIICFCSSVAQYIPKNCTVPKVMDFVDADSEKWQQYAKYSRTPMRWLYQLEAKRMRDYEQQIAISWNKCFAISESEVKSISLSKLDVLPNGVDTDYFQKNSCIKENAIVFVGTMDYFPNVDAILFFYKEIWQYILAKCPSVKLYIVGRNPTKEILKLKNSNIIVTGAVDDIRYYLNIAKVGIAPIRIARGIQNKVLEYIATGLPSVISPQAAQGINLEGLEGVWIEPCPKIFAKQVVYCLENDLVISETGQEIFKERYSWESHLKRWEKSLLHICNFL